MHHSDVERPEPRRGAARVTVDDFGRALARTNLRLVIDDYGIQVTDNPIWIDQRVDPHLSICDGAQGTP